MTQQINLSEQSLDATLTPSKVSTNPSDIFTFPSDVLTDGNVKVNLPNGQVWAGYIYDGSGNEIMNINTDELYDNTLKIAVSWQQATRKLWSNTETEMLNWSDPTSLSFGVGVASLDIVNSQLVVADQGVTGSGVSSNSNTSANLYLRNSDGSTTFAYLHAGSDANNNLILDLPGVDTFRINHSEVVTNEPSAILDVISDTQGFLTPRMSTVQKNAIVSPATGLIVYDTTLNFLQEWNGTIWTSVSPVTNPAGSDTWIQYNNSGVFGADSNLTFDYSATKTLTVTGTGDGTTGNFVVTTDGTSGQVGGGLTITTAGGSLGQTGGNLTITTGEVVHFFGGETNTGGSLILTSGHVGGDPGAVMQGGSILLTAGNNGGEGASIGGNITLTCGPGNGSSHGGDIILTGDDPVNNGGNLSLTGTGASHGTITAGGNMAIDGTTFNVDSVNHKVGVGTSSPATALEVFGAAQLDNDVTITDTFNGTAGNLTLTTATASTGGNLMLTTANSAGGQTGGSVTITTGSSGGVSDANGGGLTITTGAAAGFARGGSITLTTGAGHNPVGGSITLTTGVSFGAAPIPGNLTLTCGDQTTGPAAGDNTTGGSITLTSGNTSGGTATGGSITLTTGATSGTKVGGSITLTAATATSGGNLSLTGTGASHGTITAGGNMAIDGTTFNVDSVNHRVGVGTSSPSQLLDVGAGNIRVGNSNTYTNGFGLRTAGIYDYNGTQAIDLQDKYLLGASTFTVAWSAELLAHNSGGWSVKWGDNNVGGVTTRILIDPNATAALDWTNRLLGDATGTNGNYHIGSSAGFAKTSLDWANRWLYATDGSTIQLDWSVPGTVSLTSAALDLATHQIHNVVNPTAAQDAATKNYVDGVLSGHVVTREVPSGLVNGVNAVFTLAFTPVAGTECVFLNGLLQNVGALNDYTISGSTITFNTAPDSGGVILVNYIK